jgi:hypothetical protein
MPEFKMSSKEVLKINLQNDYGPKVRIQFKATASPTDIDQQIRNILSIKNNKRYFLSYIDENDNEPAYVLADGQALADCVLSGVKLLNVVTEENTPGKL